MTGRKNQRRHHTDVTHVLKSQLAHTLVDLAIQHYATWSAIPTQEAYDWLMSQDIPYVREWKARGYTIKLFREKLDLTFQREK